MNDKICNKPPNTLYECTIVPKVYDQCRQQDCLTEKMLGPVYSGEETIVSFPLDPLSITFPGSPINPPILAANVIILPKSFILEKILIVSKSKSLIKEGFYDITIQYIFSYIINFLASDGSKIVSSVGVNITAKNSYTKKVTLFGSTDNNVSAFSDFSVLSLENSDYPFVFIEALAKPLTINLKIVECPKIICFDPYEIPMNPNFVEITIGLFTIIKLIRLVQLKLKSEGFCIPKECIDFTQDPCKYFNELDFPFEAFTPPAMK